MRLLKLCLTGVSVWLGTLGASQASEQITIDFEGLSNSPEFVLTNQVSGIAFENVVVMTPATVRCSTGVDLSAATSGRSAASTFGAKIRFSQPVLKVSTAVSPSFVSVNLHKEATYFTAHLKAYSQGDKLIASALAPVIGAVAEPEHIRNVTPSAISVLSSVPISYVTLDFDEPWSASGARLLFDDLVTTVVEQVPPVAPTLRIERRSNERVVVLWDIMSSELERSTNLITWQPITTPTPGSYAFDPSGFAIGFFRVHR